ncbi:PD-(D/E)XK nuclease family protein [Micromonospora sp. HUAS LYJ1]|uniref:PD-(D/E)XK nuclease family protein n=1 Tax=Micromonospora sp. HUAS LYJ1 TaxID=3061626 RepID=UPI0026732B7B|nr:PD-(D/E)XK nuclease family protein [Micromonospora sp. HUAS LYJ1]WKU03978.1 PD-(D/E)XK nuclease family protein [Micromonospora sp. HUAS LYJ1]
MSTWRPPEGVADRVTTIAVSAAAPRAQKYKCPMAEALKARPSLRLRSGPRRYEKLEHFTLGPFMTALDQVERGFRSVEGALDDVERNARLHDGLKTWTAHAVRDYLRAFPVHPLNRSPLRLVPQRWTYEREIRRTRYRISAWGRCYQSVDGRTREIRMINIRSRSSTRSDAEVAVAAFVLACADQEAGSPPVEHVRVVNYSVEDGRVCTLFDGAPADATLAYEKHGRAALTEVAGGQEYRPGGACVKCDFATRCPALARAPGLLGVDGEGRPRRQWSVTSGRAYRECPARAHLRELRLPTDAQVERGGPAQRGRAVHALLADHHRTGHRCSPAIGDRWTGDDFGLSPDDIGLGRRLVRHHAEVCPLQHTQFDRDVRVEPQLTWDDQNANVLVVVEPDLLYRDHDSWVWREVKTSSSDGRRANELLTEYPQLALAVLVLARGELGGSRTRSRVELEVLRPSGVDLYVIDPYTPSVRRNAETVVRDLVLRWRADDEFLPRPGDRCTRCEVASWCRAKPETELAS